MDLYIRENYLKKIRGFYHADDLIKVITGVRRSGKSSLMQMIADELKSSGIPESQIIYFDLDKREYRNVVTADKLEALIMSKCVTDEMKYLFIDEVQNVKDFETVLNGFRTEGNWSIFITGSNSYLLSGELVTKLTGRYIEFEIFPLNFQEYEGMKAFFGKPINSNPMIELTNYILEGGFPRAILFDDMADKRKYVQGVVSEIFEKDIRKRLKIKNKENFETVRKYIINNFGATTSLNAYVVANDITTCEEGKCLMISHNVRRRGVVRYDFLFVDNNISITKCNYDYDGAIKAGSDHALIEADIRT